MSPRVLLVLAWRESRFARRRLFLFLSSISLGVAALVAVQGLATNLTVGVREQARTLLGADLALRARQPFGEGTEALLDSLRGAQVPVARVTSFASMGWVPRTQATRLVQVRAVEGGFPFYGTIETQPADLWERLPEGNNALVDPALLASLDAVVGDTLILGDAYFQILGVLERVPGDVEIASAFAPRVYIPAEFIEETGLIGFGSRVEYEAFLQLPSLAEAQRLSSAYRPVFRQERVRTRTVEENQQTLRLALERLSSYLRLTGVFALLLGGIGVGSAMRAYMAQKADSVAVLRCLGATARQVFAIYLLQAALMGLAGAALGAVIGVAAQWLLPGLLTDLLPVEVQVGIDGWAVLAGLGVGLWVALAFAALPLLETRRISPLRALRRQVESLERRERDGWRYVAWAALAASVLLITVLQAGSWRIGAAFAAGVALTLAALWFIAWAVTRGVRRLRSGGLPYTARQGLANLYRPGNQTRAVVVALGFGVFLLSTLYLAQHALLAPLRPDPAGTRANLLLWDVQQDQQQPVADLLRERGSHVVQQVPIIPMRIAAINGSPVRRDGRVQEYQEGEEEWGDGDGQTGSWALRREYRSTYRDTLVSSEQLRAGRWWGASSTAAEVSLEQGVAEELGVGVGDRLTWDVQGVEITTTVTSVREVDWARFEPNFFAVFPTAVLVEAPQTWVVLAGEEDPAERTLVQRELVERFPNVAIIDLTQLQQALDTVIGRISAVIRFIAGFSILTGFVVLLGTVATGRLQRIRESVLLKTLGATRRQIGSILFAEYLLLGFLASLVGVAVSLAAGWGLARWLFRIPFGVPPLPLLALVSSVTLLAVLVGVWGSREVFRRTPLEAIREE